MPRKGTSKTTPAQRQRVAVGKLRGETSKEIAAAIGKKPGTVDHIAIDPRTKSLMAEEKRKHSKLLSLMFARSLNTINHYVGDGRTRTKEDGALALRAAGLTMNVITAGESKLDVDRSSAGDFTFAELFEHYVNLKQSRQEKGLPL